MASSTLNHVIDHTTLPRLQSLVKKLCDASPSARALVEQELLDSSTDIIDLTVDYEAPTTQTDTEGVKRQRYVMCKHCKEEFDVTDNGEEDCQYHDENLEIYWEGDFWADHDEDCHGTIDLDLAEEFPEGFVWTCCMENGEHEGRKIGPHEVDERYKPEEVKRKRIWE
ncbi:hypothetical protein KCU95_g18230, partial [Aureobasidium melanogenum]